MNYQMHTLLAIIIVFWKIIHNEVNLVSFLVYGNSGKSFKTKSVVRKYSMMYIVNSNHQVSTDDVILNN